MEANVNGRDVRGFSLLSYQTLRSPIAADLALNANQVAIHGP